jgi:hypothetical protein
MTRLLELLISLAIVAVLFLVVGVLLPSSRSLTESVETNRKMTIVYDTINSLRRFDDWNALALRDPNMKIERSGPDSGVGARLDYSSDIENVGSGSWEIVETEENRRVLYAVENNARGDNKRMEFLLEPTGRSGRNVEITQKYRVDYGWDLLGRYSGLYVSRNVGDTMELGLGRLSNMLATVPNVDYRVEGSKMADLEAVARPAEHLLVVNAGAVERNNEKIKASMKSNVEWIKRTMDANDLVAAGPMRIISTELGRENYTFDVAQPVRKRDSGEAAASDEDSDGEEGETLEAPPAAPAPVAAAPLQDLELLGPVTYVHTEPTRAAKASYTGFMAELENVRNALRAWALTQGYEVIDRPYEFYENGIDQAFTADGEYEVYWTLKQ